MDYSATMHSISIQATELFQALSDQTRLRVVRLLGVTREEACLCELAESLSVPDYTLSRHVKVLRKVGLLTAEKEGRWVYHRVVHGPESLNALVAVVVSLPDPDKRFAQDHARFVASMTGRTDGRCRGDGALTKDKTA